MKAATVSFWIALYGIVILYVAWRMQAFALWKPVTTPEGLLNVPNTFASVDHPFHVARADTLWRELGSGRLLRWIGQHQGGYPVEFYPLGEAWFEAAIRALSLNQLTPEGAHTLAVIALFLLPGAAFAALARVDGLPPSVSFLALSLQIALPGGWYGGGYTELVQWGLVTNVAGATVSLLALPAFVSAISQYSPRAMALASVLAAIALYCNPRSAIGLMAIGLGALVATILLANSVRPRLAFLRLVQIAVLTGLLAAPLLISLSRFGALYEFVHYSGYASFLEYVTASWHSLSAIVLTLGLTGMLAGLLGGRIGARAASATAAIYIATTAAVAFTPFVDTVAPQLEPTRLMPLQRFLLLYLAAAFCWLMLSNVVERFAKDKRGAREVIFVGVSIISLLFLTRPVLDEPPDPSSTRLPAVSLYPVAMSAQPEQVSLKTAIQTADREASSSTAVLVLGSDLSWHQQLWAPLWTERPLYYDNWLWYWHFDHAGTPGYEARAGHHYPDPEGTLTPEYLNRFGIGAVVASRSMKVYADESPLLIRIADGDYSAYLVENPSPIVTFEPGNTTFAKTSNASIEARSSQVPRQANVRLNWFPRWTVQDGTGFQVERSDKATMIVTMTEATTELEMEYVVQPLDWLARALAGLGLVVIAWLVIWPFRRQIFNCGSDASRRGAA